MSNGFSIDKFKKNQATEVKRSLPVWVNTDKPKIVFLVNSIDSEFSRIEKRINDSGSKLSVSERQIKNIKICEMSGVVKSYLRRDRDDTKSVIDYLSEKNILLNKLWLKSKAGESNSGRKLLKADLDIENRKLKKQLKEAEKSVYYTYFEKWIETYSTSDHKNMVAKINDLKEKVRSLEDEKSELKSDLDKWKGKVIESSKFMKNRL